MRPDLNKLMQQAQEMQRRMQENQVELAQREIIGEAGAGLVKIITNGNHATKQVMLDDRIVPSLNSEDKEMLQDLITAAINNANNKIKEATASTMPGLPSDLMNLPDLVFLKAAKCFTVH